MCQPDGVTVHPDPQSNVILDASLRVFLHELSFESVDEVKQGTELVDQHQTMTTGVPKPT